jgi:hypothetical protein
MSKLLTGTVCKKINVKYVLHTVPVKSLNPPTHSRDLIYLNFYIRKCVFRPLNVCRNKMYDFYLIHLHTIPHNDRMKTGFLEMFANVLKMNRYLIYISI